MTQVETSRKRLQAILQLSAVPGLNPVRLNRLFDAVSIAGLGVEALSGLGRADLISRLGFAPWQADAFSDASMWAQMSSDRTRSDHLHVMTRVGTGWPAHLRRDDARAATPWLFVLGNPSLLAQRLIGIGGSRDATAQSEKITGDLVRRLVERDVVIVSGGARGIDSLAHAAALSAGGRTIVVLAQGIGTFHVPAQWREPIRQGRLAVVSEYLPEDDWEAFRAIQRNATIVQMSDSFIVAQAGETGGTLSAGQAALKMRWPLHVVRQTGTGAECFPGNEMLIQQGGRPLPTPLHYPVPDADVDAILAAQPPPNRQRVQLGLF